MRSKTLPFCFPVSIEKYLTLALSFMLSSKMQLGSCLAPFGNKETVYGWGKYIRIVWNVGQDLGHTFPLLVRYLTSLGYSFLICKWGGSYFSKPLLDFTLISLTFKCGLLIKTSTGPNKYISGPTPALKP